MCDTGFIPHSRPALGEAEAGRAAETVMSGLVAQGKTTERFERAFAERMGGGHAAAVSTGTAALHLALLALGITKGDEVAIPSYVCTALLNAVNYTGATPVIADIDPETLNISPNDLKKRLTGKTRAVIVPHMFGLPADMDALSNLGIPVIGDCAQAVGALYGNKQVAQFGEAAVFSFYATKVMTTGEGGMVFSKSKSLVDRVKNLRAYDNPDTYEIRYNYKMTDIQAAIGLAQLDRLDEFIRRRDAIADRYDNALKPLGLKTPKRVPGRIWFRYILNVDDAGPRIESLRKAGIGAARPVDIPIHRLFGNADCPMTDRAWRASVSIPIYPALSDADVDRICLGKSSIYRY